MFFYFDKFSNLKSFPTECDCCGKKLLNSVRVMRGKISLSRPSGFALLRLKANFVVFFIFYNWNELKASFHSKKRVKCLKLCERTKICLHKMA